MCIRDRSERLAFAYGYIGSVFSRCFDYSKRYGIHAHDEFCSGFVGKGGCRFRIFEVAVIIRVLDIYALSLIHICIWRANLP